MRIRSKDVLCKMLGKKSVFFASKVEIKEDLPSDGEAPYGWCGAQALQWRSNWSSSVISGRTSKTKSLLGMNQAELDKK